MEDSTPTPQQNRTVHHTANAALWAQHDRANTLAAALDAVRAWRLTQPGGAEFAPLDAILDAAALGDDAPLLRLQATTPQEAVAGLRAVMQARARALDAARLVWDQVEAAQLRTIDERLHKPSTTTIEITADATALEAAVKRAAGGRK
ncbi:hypothetical protein [Streptomyces violarus]|uniref:hypothetical protein n=1 Tax=Streptomyces violarus TaxID=67380 RepID=UPI0021C17325|nr:hypothetical protein [Streptomyces violarus]MCT9145374.1 hypothetical protein [Streptomyces violarus]